MPLLCYINDMHYLVSNIPFKRFYASINSDFCRYGWKRKVVNVPVSYHYWKKSLERKLFKYFISLQVQLKNLSSSYLCNYLCISVYVCIFLFVFVCIYICIFYMCNLFICVYVGVHLCFRFWTDSFWKIVSFRLFSEPFRLAG